ARVAVQEQAFATGKRVGDFNRGRLTIKPEEPMRRVVVWVEPHDRPVTGHKIMGTASNDCRVKRLHVGGELRDDAIRSAQSNVTRMRCQRTREPFGRKLFVHNLLYLFCGQVGSVLPIQSANVLLYL